jgi:hypothetical protein
MSVEPRVRHSLAVTFSKNISPSASETRLMPRFTALENASAQFLRYVMQDVPSRSSDLEEL